jgi:hypothetical protein
MLAAGFHLVNQRVDQHRGAARKEYADRDYLKGTANRNRGRTQSIDRKRNSGNKDRGVGREVVTHRRQGPYGS